MVVTLHSQTGNNNPEMLKYSNGAVVQLVRIHACHAWGRGFESRPHRRGERKSSKVNFGFLLLFFVIHFSKNRKPCFSR